jgi:hypothetical protein
VIPNMSRYSLVLLALLVLLVLLVPVKLRNAA